MPEIYSQRSTEKGRRKKCLSFFNHICYCVPQPLSVTRKKYIYIYSCICKRRRAVVPLLSVLPTLVVESCRVFWDYKSRICFALFMLFHQQKQKRLKKRATSWRLKLIMRRPPTRPIVRYRFFLTTQEIKWGEGIFSKKGGMASSDWGTDPSPGIQEMTGPLFSLNCHSILSHVIIDWFLQEDELLWKSSAIVVVGAEEEEKEDKNPPPTKRNCQRIAGPDCSVSESNCWWIPPFPGKASRYEALLGPCCLVWWLNRRKINRRRERLKFSRQMQEFSLIIIVKKRKERRGER